MEGILSCLVSVAQHGHQLRTISWNRHVVPDDIIQILFKLMWQFSEFGQLTQYDMSCRFDSDDDIMILLQCCHRITDTAVITVAAHYPQLTQYSYLMLLSLRLDSKHCPGLKNVRCGYISVGIVAGVHG